MGKKKQTHVAAPTTFKIAIPTHVKLDTATRVTDGSGHILHKTILNQLMPGHIVRISMHVSKNSPYDCRLDTDAPYVKILEIKQSGSNQTPFFLGVILETNRGLPEYYYPLKSHEKLWFSKTNIIEISDLSADDIAKFGTGEHIAYTGRLETIDHETSDTESEYSDSSQSSSEDEKVECAMAKLDRLERARFHPR
jgi:hypothetical protein